MAGAGPTRRGSYAHVGSKEELSAGVAAADHGLIRMLAFRTLGTLGTLVAELSRRHGDTAARALARASPAQRAAASAR